jgi:hypothetical protein
MSDTTCEQCPHCGFHYFQHQKHICVQHALKHHEIFKLVLDHTLSRGLETIEQMNLTTPEAVIAMCRKYADLAYPKETP